MSKFFKKMLCLGLAICTVKLLSTKGKIEEEKDIRDNLSEKQIDKMVESSFPASDPPSTY